MNSYAEYLHYFRAWSKGHVAMKYFVTGDVDRIINLERTRIKYPVLWLETPEATVEGSKITWQGAWVILKHVKTDDWDRQNAIIDETFRLAEDLLQRMRNDAGPLFQFEGKPMLRNISTFTHDNDYGWRCTFTIVAHSYKCIPAFYHQNWGPFLMAQFRWKHDYLSPGFDNLTFENITLPSKGTSLVWQWTFQQDGEDPTYSTDRIPDPYTNHDIIKPLRVQLLVQTADEIFSNIAKAIIPPSERSYGYSFPEPLEITEII